MTTNPFPFEPDRFACEVSGTWYIAKDDRYAPHQANTGSTGRYHQLGTGSVYLGLTPATCEVEVGREGRSLYECSISGAGFFDLGAACDQHPEIAPKVLEASGSGGWEPTQDIARFLHSEGFAGIKYRSHHDSNLWCVVYWQDRHDQRPESFTQISWPARDDS